MKRKAVHVLIEKGIESPRANDAILIAQKTEGPLHYTLEPFNFEEPLLPTMAS